MPRPVRAAVTTALVSLLIAGCTASDAGGAADGAAPENAASTLPASPHGESSPVTTRLAAPWSITFVDGTPLVSERDSGRVLEVADDGTTREVGVVAGVDDSGEAGLLGLAVDDRRRLFVYSTGADGNRIQRYDLRGDPGALALGAPVTLVDGIPAASFHDGGRLAFGPDGMLYASTGDAGVPELAQDPDSLAGKILRMTADGDAPDDNPSPGSLVYSSGHRNVQGLAWADDGTLFATEFGQSTWDELNVVEPGANYGWPEVEGAAGVEGFVDPVQQWRPEDASPSGLAQLGGTLFVANLRGEALRAVPVDDPSTSAVVVDDEGRLRDAVVAPDGSLWVLTNNTDGRGSPGEDDDRILRLEIAGS
ncbi:sorbosone dehydrogenase family protein [Isoptericola sp. 178]|uniref:PQQ-dependent sugar dehydrogenase n=1 Tax=Isoptericola sp. 178 TaxID=3064651 RepID=UPI002712A1EA|nr:PQQ-dependent sugar dehydrogenase [Isoptericola sp. 178]MDO8145829.1 PQQ-dependent sugar dehydrogenase [Isoptericola sp. 178]